MKRYLILTLLLAGSQLRAAAEVGQLHDSLAAEKEGIGQLRADIKEKKLAPETPAAQTGPQQRAMLMLGAKKGTMEKVVNILEKHENDPGKARDALSRLREKTNRDIKKLKRDIKNYDQQARRASHTVDVCKKGDAAAKKAGLEAGRKVIEETRQALKTEPPAEELPPAPVPVV